MNEVVSCMIASCHLIQVEELRQARQRQEAMVESIIVERDMYKARVDAAAR